MTMINYLQNSVIDKQRWDDCIRRSVNRRVYAFSWYLDAVCPGWDALVGDDYDSVFPLTHNRKWGISYLYQPFFAQQLGLFSVRPVTGDMLSGFVSAIPSKFRFVEIQLNSMNNFDPGCGELTQRVNHELNIAATCGELSAQFSQNTKRNIRKSKEMEVTAGRETGVDELIALFRENFGAREGKLQPHHYQALRALIVRCQENGTGRILGAAGADGQLDAAAFFLQDLEHVYFLFAASSSRARGNGAMFTLVDSFLAENAGKYRVLDFEGGNDPNLGRFYKSFGASEVSYPGLRINRLSGTVTAALNFIRRLRP
jgi:hypothetical protein